tara:strand:- start:87 stop:380 length:294 start_codon:yes stop_codon:yes gene_type:complete
MKTITIIYLATLFYSTSPTEKENVYSWQITFNTYQECELFYDSYNANLLNGLLNHGKEKYGKKMGVDYLSCAKVEIDENFPEPHVLGQKVLYSVERN